MYLKKLLYLLFVLPFLFTACSDDDDSDPVGPGTNVNESEVLVKYLEENGDFVNTYAPAMITAESVKSMLGDDNQVIIDIRSASDFANGHIEGSVNVTLKNIVSYYESNNLSSKTQVVIVCYSGQTAGYATGLLRLKGYDNVKDLKWGINSWNADLSSSWSGAIGNNYANFVTTASAKNSAGELPSLSTGKITGKEILDARVDAILGSADPFGDAKISINQISSNLSGYYIINYWPENHYTAGHLDGAVQYTPKQSLKLDVDLKTLPKDRTIVVYCYTGQTSSQVVAYLRLLGYDAKSLLFGVSTMNYNLFSQIGFHGFDDNEIKGYAYVK